MVATLLAERGIRLLSFDLDDTLVDTDAAAPARLEAAVRRAFEVIEGVDRRRLEMAYERGMAADPITEGRIPAFLAVLGLRVEDERAAAIRQAYNAELIGNLELMDGAEDVLQRLRGRFTLAVVTNGPADLQRPKIDKFRIHDLVDHVVVSGEVGVWKPDPAIFGHALGAAGVEPWAAAHVGDSLEADIAGANAAGMTSIWLLPRLRAPRTPEEHEPDAIIGRLSELLPA
jgi:HAD superfamily hydrolase (TIGR01509 family)